MLCQKEPCPKCGSGIYQLGSRNYHSHLRYQNETENINNNDGNTGDDQSVDKTTNAHACTDRGVLESILNNEFDYFEFNDENYKGWEQQANCGSSGCGSSEGPIKDEEAHDINSKKEGISLTGPEVWRQVWC